MSESAFYVGTAFGYVVKIDPDAKTVILSDTLPPVKTYAKWPRSIEGNRTFEFSPQTSGSFTLTWRIRLADLPRHQLYIWQRGWRGSTQMSEN